MPALGGRKVVRGGGANPGPVRWLYHLSPAAALPGAGAQRCLADHRSRRRSGSSDRTSLDRVYSRTVACLAHAGRSTWWALLASRSHCLPCQSRNALPVNPLCLSLVRPSRGICFIATERSSTLPSTWQPSRPLRYLFLQSLFLYLLSINF